MKRPRDTTADEAQPAKVHPLFATTKAQTGAGSAHVTVTWSVVADGAVLVGRTAPATATSGPTHASEQAGMKVAAFDFDGTISLSGGTHVFSKAPDDWRFLHPVNVRAKLRELHQDGYRIVIISNQKDLITAGKKTGRSHSNEDIFKGKIAAVARDLGIPLLVLAAMDDLFYRKPSVGMWNLFVRDYNDGVQPDPTVSFYVGDAAGRPERADRATGKPIKKDHGCSDLKFALNCGLPFYVPEVFFNIDARAGDLVPTRWDFNPRTWTNGTPLFTPASTPLLPTDPTAEGPEVILLVGAPASGKTSFSAKHLLPHGYVHINQDTLKDRKKCLAAMVDALKAGKNCVVDNTNPTAAVRGEYIRDAKPYAKRVRAFVFTVSMELCEHNNKVRAKWTKGKGKGVERAKIPDMVFRTYQKNLEPPDVSKEPGLSEVKRINFVAEFEDDEHKSVEIAKKVSKSGEQRLPRPPPHSENDCQECCGNAANAHAPRGALAGAHGWIRREQNQVLDRHRRQDAIPPSPHSQPISNFASTAYYTTVQFGGGQRFMVDVDTGSDNLWIPSKTCTTCIGISPFYDSAQSATFQPTIGSLQNITYAAGSVLGTLARDTVTWGNLSVTGQPFLLVTAEDTVAAQSFQGQGDGILGLTLQDGMAAIMQYQIQYPFFSLWFNRSSITLTNSDPLGGRLSIGGVDPSLYHGEFTFLPVERSAKSLNPDRSTTKAYYWSLAGNYLQVGNTVIQAPAQTSFILDSGTTLLTLDADSLHRFLPSLFSGPSADQLRFDQQEGFYGLSCHFVHTLPSVTFNMGSRGAGHNFTLTPLDYVLPSPTRNGFCILGFQQLDNVKSGDTYWVLGDLFLRKFYTVFDLKGLQVGFAAAANGTVEGDGVPLTQALLQRGAQVEVAGSGASGWCWRIANSMLLAALLAVFVC
ncbi:aspartic peptidase domain-containing protein [Chytriomyces sp. MP71]|nr:aspartic peptidase domain-containing protein [Chytriomyces sp. MP71]